MFVGRRLQFGCSLLHVQRTQSAVRSWQSAARSSPPKTRSQWPAASQTRTHKSPPAHISQLAAPVSSNVCSTNKRPPRSAFVSPKRAAPNRWCQQERPPAHSGVASRRSLSDFGWLIWSWPKKKLLMSQFGRDHTTRGLLNRAPRGEPSSKADTTVRSERPRAACWRG